MAKMSVVDRIDIVSAQTVQDAPDRMIWGVSISKRLKTFAAWRKQCAIEPRMPTGVIPKGKQRNARDSVCPFASFDGVSGRLDAAKKTGICSVNLFR